MPVAMDEFPIHQAPLSLEGSGMFEHGTFGRHDPSGFAGYELQAP